MKKNVSLSVGRGEKLPVSKGAGLTAKGREKYNAATQYSPFTKDDYDNAYPQTIKPVEERIEKYKSWRYCFKYEVLD